MPNPAKPIEQKRLLGNPGRKPLPDKVMTVALEGGKVEPLRELEQAGQQLWDSVFNYAELWISPRTDVHLLQMTCEQLDRREQIKQAIASSEDWHLFKQLNDLERLVSSNLGLLGFTPSDRSRLGLAEIKAKSRLQELLERNA